MAPYRQLPIWRCAMALALGLEQSVACLPSTHRYALGAELRRLAGVMQPLIAPVNPRSLVLSTPPTGIL